jgi:hypothetical protein
MGCYRSRVTAFEDLPDLSSLNNGYYPYYYMTIEACTTYCFNDGYRYAGLQDGYVILTVLPISSFLFLCMNYSLNIASGFCYCGNSYGEYGPSSRCNASCLGNSWQTCGGYISNSIYSLNYEVTPSIQLLHFSPI